jgi:hypothetical protein
MFPRQTLLGELANRALVLKCPAPCKGVGTASGGPLYQRLAGEGRAESPQNDGLGGTVLKPPLGDQACM